MFPLRHRGGKGARDDRQPLLQHEGGSDDSERDRQAPTRSRHFKDYFNLNAIKRRPKIPFLVAFISLALIVILAFAYHISQDAKRQKAKFDADHATVAETCRQLGIDSEQCLQAVAKQNSTIVKLITSSLDHRVSPCDDFFNHACGNYNIYLLDFGVDSFWQIVQNFNSKVLIQSLQNIRSSKSKAVRFLVEYFNECLHTESAEDCFERIADMIDQYQFQYQRAKIYLDGLVAVQGKEYVQKTRRKIVNLVRRLRQALADIFEKNDWLDEQTKSVIQEKLISMRQKIAYDEWNLEDDKLDAKLQMNIAPGVIEGNLEKTEKLWERHFTERVIKNIDFPWVTEETAKVMNSPIDLVNAQYNRELHGIVIHLGFLQKPLFDLNDPLAIHYGFLGFTIGHELIHAFDGKDFQYDGWTKEAMNKFFERNKCLHDQYSNITESITRQKVSGKQTLYENIADNAGIKVAYKAFLKELKSQAKESRSSMPSTEYKLYSPSQLFFYSYAMGWCEAKNREKQKAKMEKSVHAPNKLRVNVVLQNMKSFSEAFDCKLGSYMNPRHKCELY